MITKEEFINLCLMGRSDNNNDIALALSIIGNDNISIKHKILFHLIRKPIPEEVLKNVDLSKIYIELRSHFSAIRQMGIRDYAEFNMSVEEYIKIAEPKIDNYLSND